MADHSSSPRKEHIESGSSSSNKRLLVEDADRLSTLPLEIQSQILSFLPTIDAAKVGLLSKMGRTIWYSLSKLSFNYCQFPETGNKLNAFVNFIDQTLAYHDESDVKTLEVWLWPFIGCDIAIKTVWITFAILHKVEKLVLFGRIDEIKLPDCLFSCQSLVKLELAVPDLVLPSSETFTLPNLRKLKLKFLLLSELTLGQDLFSSLPALEKLSIFFCDIGYPRDISISCMKLTEFVICDCPGMETCSFKLRNSCLSRFIYITNASEMSVLNVSPSAFRFIIYDGNAIVVSECDYELSRSIIKVTGELFKNTFLSLSHWLIEYLSIARDLWQVTFDPFPNVTVLNINMWPVREHIEVLMLLVSRCPYLNQLSLVLKMPQRGSLDLLSEDSLAEYGTEGGFCKVKYVRIENFEGDETDVMLVKFLLANMIELRLMSMNKNFMRRSLVRPSHGSKFVKRSPQSSPNWIPKQPHASNSGIPT